MKLISNGLNVIVLLWLFVTIASAHNSSGEVKLNGTQILAALTSNPIHHIVGKVVDFFRHLVSGGRSKSTVANSPHNVTDNSVSTKYKSNSCYGIQLNEMVNINKCFHFGM